ncbi:MAG: site-specific DNA-methyltransferase [Phycisphaerae bacterium]|nr:site-specific DNA-methyltransferase [Phycisphaerae bacterium]
MLFPTSVEPQPTSREGNGAIEPFGRLDLDQALRAKIHPLCRLKMGEIWEDPIRGHRVGVLDAANHDNVQYIVGDDLVNLVVNDPPYNVAVGNANTRNLSKLSLSEYITFSRRWVSNCLAVMQDNAHLYVWLGTDYKDGFQPLPDFMVMMREFAALTPRSFITLRNQRGYGTQKNWMWVRQELLHYRRGNPHFSVVYTEIPKILRGYYKTVNGKRTENLERSKSDKLRPGNVWVDIQQVFYRMQENVPGCYAQKPLKAIERIILTSSRENDVVLDCFSHSGTTLVVGEQANRRVFTFDIDPIFAEITIRRLERLRQCRKTGWQWHNPFPELEEADDAAAIARLS